jgi:hypothetical protein
MSSPVSGPGPRHAGATGFAGASQVAAPRRTRRDRAPQASHAITPPDGLRGRPAARHAGQRFDVLSKASPVRNAARKKLDAFAEARVSPPSASITTPAANATSMAAHKSHSTAVARFGMARPRLSI